MEEKIGALEEETKKLKESAKEKEDNARMILFNLKYKLKSVMEEKEKLSNDLKLSQASISPAPATSTTTASASMAANSKNLKSSNYFTILTHIFSCMVI